MRQGQEITPPRQGPLAGFLAALEAAFDGASLLPPARDCITGVFAAARTATPTQAVEGEKLDVLQWLDPILHGLRAQPGAMGDLGRGLGALAPSLGWSTRKAVGPTASAGFSKAHANAVVLGPGGMEPRNDIWVGLSLMAPGTRYPDHDHPPEEVYLVLTDGAFYQAGAGWQGKAAGDTVYNPPGIVHAMRTGIAPFLAIWCLRA